MPLVRTGSDGENGVWFVSAVGQPQQVIELGSLGDQILDNLCSLESHARPVDGGPKILAAEHGQEHSGELHSSGVRVGVLLKVALILHRHQSSVRFAGSNGVKGFLHLEEVREDSTLAAKFVKRRHEAGHILDGIVPLAQKNKALQVLDAEKHIRFMDKRFEGGAIAPPEEGEKATVTKPRHAGVIQWTPHLLALGGE